ncbi:CpaF family protein [Cellulomonas fimi]|uniref:CpaF family protein n=1 Tax=Cellulomonas fimi TaxID=1708 RepID=A0A7Y0M298_CELFI|nr:CpaF family protein [Cellulomonas fimi]
MTDDNHSRPGYRRNGHSSNGRAHLVSIPALDVLPADPAGVPGSGPPWIGAEAAPELSVIDVVLVREVRGAVAGQLAARLQADHVQDPGARRELARALITDELAQRARARVRAGEDPWPQAVEFATARAVMAALFGLGRLQPLVDDPDVDNIEVDGHDRVWVSYADGRDQVGPAVAESNAELIETLQLLAARSGSAERTFSSAHPVLHLRLDDGSRLTAMAWVTPQPHVVIRRHRVRDVDLEDLVTLGTLDTGLSGFLRAALRAGKNIVVTGLQNAGKTTLIRALANEFAPMERFATIEKEYELHLHDLPDRHPRVVAMEAREGSSEKDRAGRRAGEVTLSDLVTDALRMNLRRRGSALGFRNLTNYIARSLLETGGFRPRLHPQSR